MRKIGFIGAYDKTDFILYLAKILVEMGQRILVVDGTITQKARYVVPSVEKTRSYITQYEGIDVAVGLKSFEDIKTYLGVPVSGQLPYDITLIDTDTAGAVMSYGIAECEKIFFTTSFDMYSIKRGIESLAGIQESVHATKILFARNVMKEENDYLNYLSTGSNIIWDKDEKNKETIIYFPFELGDQTVIYTNQRVSKIKLKRLTNQYKVGLQYIIQMLMGIESYDLIKKAFKRVEKGV